MIFCRLVLIDNQSINHWETHGEAVGLVYRGFYIKHLTNCCYEATHSLDYSYLFLLLRPECKFKSLSDYFLMNVWSATENVIHIIFQLSQHLSSSLNPWVYKSINIETKEILARPYYFFCHHQTWFLFYFSRDQRQTKTLLSCFHWGWVRPDTWSVNWGQENLSWVEYILHPASLNPTEYHSDLSFSIEVDVL